MWGRKILNVKYILQFRLEKDVKRKKNEENSLEKGLFCVCVISG